MVSKPSDYDDLVSEYAKEFQEVTEHLEEFLLLVPKNGTIVDLGCGVGNDVKFCAEQGFSVTGIDYSKKMIDVAKRNSPNTKFICKNFFSLKGKFNAIIAAFSLIHLTNDDIQKALRKFFLCLKKDGILFLAMQEGEEQKRIIESPLMKEKKLSVTIVKEEKFIKMLDAEGFQIMKKYKRNPKLKELPFNKLFIIAKRRE